MLALRVPYHVPQWSTIIPHTFTQLTQSLTAPGVPQAPGSPSGLNVPNFLHFIALAARVLFLLPLFPVLLKPATTYSALQRPPPSPTHDPLLLPGAAPQPAYGTFAPDAPLTSMRPGSSPATKAPEGYDTEPRHEAVPTEDAPLLTRSRKSSGASDSSKKSKKSKDFEPVAVTALTDEPEALPNTSARGAPQSHPTDVLDTDDAAAAATALEAPARADVASDIPSEEAGSSSKHPQSTDAHGPVSFPTGDDASSLRGSTRGSIRKSIRGSIRSIRGGVNFGKDGKDREPHADDAETASTKEKRKGSASQNFQRLARRVSLVPKRQASTSSSVSAAQSAPKKDSGTGSGFLNMMKIRREESNASEASSSSSPQPDGNSEEPKKEKKKKRMSLKI